MTNPPPAVVVRPLHEADHEQLVAIYNHYIANSPSTFDLTPYTLASRRAWFEQFNNDRHICLVAEQNHTVVGYANSARFRTKAAYDTSVETSVYIAPDKLGCGLGARLYTALFEQLDATSVHRYYAGVTLPNNASVALHGNFGFESVGQFAEVGYKFNQFWDVLWLERANPS